MKEYGIPLSIYITFLSITLYSTYNMTKAGGKYKDLLFRKLCDVDEGSRATQHPPPPGGHCDSNIRHFKKPLKHQI